MEKDLFIDTITIDDVDSKMKDKYPFNIKCVKNFKGIKLNKRVTFLIGENGVGKSTFIEALAINLKLNPEGGTQNFMFSTNNTCSVLHEYLRVYGRGSIPKTKFFLRAESFYNFSSEVQRLAEEDGYMTLYDSYGGNLHNCSHGESFLKLIQNRFTGNGLYILDEPEAALSPSRQLSLLCLIDDLVKDGSQFIIATHSPILISYRDGEILDLDNDFKKIEYEDTDIYKTYKMYLNDYKGMQRRLFDDN